MRGGAWAARALCVLVGFILLSCVPTTSEAKRASERPSPCWDTSGKSSPQRRIADCTRLLQSERGAKKRLANVYNARAAAYLEGSDLDRAIDDFNKALELRPGFVAFLRNRGTAYAYKGQFDRAIRDYDEAVRLDPESADTVSSRGLVYSKMRDFDRALADLDRALTINPKLVEARMRRAVIYANRGQYEQAFSDAGKAHKLISKPTSEDFNRTCWIRVLANVDLDIAVQECDRGLEIAPPSNKPYILHSRAVAFMRRGELAASMSDFDASLKLARDIDKRLRAMSLYGRGLVKLRMGDQTGGEADKAAALAIEASIADEYSRHNIK